MKDLLKYLGITSIFMLSVASAAFSQQGSITNDGRFVAISEDKTLDGSGKTLVLQSTINGWKNEIKGAPIGVFTSDSKQCWYKKNDTLYQFQLGGGVLKQIPNVLSFIKISYGTIDWMVCKLKGATKGLLVLNCFDGKEFRFENISDYLPNPVIPQLLIKKVIGKEKLSLTQLELVDLSNNRSKIIWSWENAEAGNYCFDTKGGKLAFIQQRINSNKFVNSIWYYETSMPNAELLVKGNDIGVDSTLFICPTTLRFTGNNDQVLFYLKEKSVPAQRKTLSKIDIWSYTDAKLQTQQIKDLVPKRFLATVSLAERKVLQIEKDGETAIGSFPIGIERSLNDIEISGDFAMLIHFDSDITTGDDKAIIPTYTMNESNWNKRTICSLYLVSLKNGRRVLLREHIQAESATFPLFKFSPGGKYVIFYDQGQKNYFTYEVQSGHFRNITTHIKTGWSKEEQEGYPRAYYEPVGIIGWAGDDQSVLLADHYSDIWRVNPLGIAGPVNLTRSCARRNKLTFRVINPQPIQKESTPILLKVTDRKNEYANQGFYSLTLRNSGELNMLLRPGGTYNYDQQTKTDSAYHIYLFRRQNSKTNIGFCYTRDFVDFIPVSSSQPEKRKLVNKKLIAWKTFDGTLSRGILYYPDNFNPLKKYPIIFIYYEKMFPESFDVASIKREPHPLEGYNDYSGLISKGYLVFGPDIHYKVGLTGQSVYNTVVSAAEYLAKKPYVDRSKMGIHGFSFGGYETNFLVTHTHIFAAAWSMSGASDLFSLYGSDEKDEEGFSQATSVDMAQYRIGTTLWARPDLYIRNSPIFYADKVTTPLLISHNKQDDRVPYGQSIEFFKALRRLGKRSWLLSGTGGHGGPAGIYAEQFFDHYLKGAPAPFWMTRGVSARQKEKEDNGSAFDTTMRTPGPGLVMEKEINTPQQRELLKHRTTVNNDGRIVEVRQQKTKNKK